MPQNHRTVSTSKIILIAGIVAGSFDISAAFIQAYLRSGTTPERVLQYIASGVFSREAFSGGLGMAGWGLLFHFIIAISLAAFFAWLYGQFRWFSRHPVLAGIFYGIFAWLITTRVILPLSNTPPAGPFSWKQALISISILVFMLGLPIAGITRYYYSRNNRKLN